MTDLSDKKVEDFSPEDFEAFWKPHIRKQIKYICEICSKPIERDRFVDHMERNHSRYYEKHDKSVEKSTDVTNKNS